jgi:hypothetical protein
VSDSSTQWTIYRSQSCRFGLVHADQPRSETRRSADALCFCGHGTGIRVAIADGCSESPAGGAWARQLCESAISDEMLELSIQVSTLAAIYRHAQGLYQRPEAASPRQARYMRQVPNDEATFLVADVDIGHEGVTARIAAVGDTQILVLDPGAPPRSFPFGGLAEFTAPDLLSSGDLARDRVAGARDTVKLGLPHDTVFVVCTDEVARWLLSSVEAGLVADLRRSMAVTLERADRLSALAENVHPSLVSDDDLTLGVFTLLPPSEQDADRESDGMLFSYDALNACVAALNRGGS